MAWTSTNEPVRRNGLAAGAIVAGGTFFGGLATALSLMEDPTTLAIIVAVLGGLGVALLEFGVVAGFMNNARNQVWGPESHEAELIDSVSHAVQTVEVLSDAQEDGYISPPMTPPQ